MFNLQKNECPVQIHADSIDPLATEQVELIVHSGSRNLGKRVAEHFQGKAAGDLCIIKLKWLQ